VNNCLIDISEASGYLHTKNRQLIIQFKDESPPASVPIEDITALVISSPDTIYSHQLLSALSESGVCLIVCGRNRLPNGILLPIQGHSTQTERLKAQAEAKLPLKKQLWKSIVQAKITNQAHLLKKLRGDDFGLLYLSNKVRSGDPDNKEGQAAKIYWSNLFNTFSFTRGRNEPPPNNYLNYGYAVLRAIVARAICTSGLHPSLGIHHHNRYNFFCLADDIMEPFRPIVDEEVVQLVRKNKIELSLNSEHKKQLLQALTKSFVFNGETRTLFDIISRITSNLAQIFLAGKGTFCFPNIISKRK